MNAETAESTYVPTPPPPPHPRRPYAVVDHDGFVWPWDGRDPNEYLLAAGSRYIYDKTEFKALLAASAEKRYVTGGLNPDVAPEPPDAPVDMAEASRAMGFKPEGKKAGRSAPKTDALTGL